jgi:hypothetical protein
MNPFKCPKCGSQKLTVSEKYRYSRYFRLEDNMLFGLTEPKCETALETWIDCSDCRELSGYRDGPGPTEWIANEEEKKIIWDMLDKASEPVDVSEFLEKEEE